MQRKPIIFATLNKIKAVCVTKAIRNDRIRVHYSLCLLPVQTNLFRWKLNINWAPADNLFWCQCTRCGANVLNDLRRKHGAINRRTFSSRFRFCCEFFCTKISTQFGPNRHFYTIQPLELRIEEKCAHLSMSEAFSELINSHRLLVLLRPPATCIVCAFSLRSIKWHNNGFGVS